MPRGSGNPPRARGGGPGLFFRRLGPALAASLWAIGIAACGGGGNACGPSSATVERVVDGDTLEIGGGEKVRLLMVNAPEITSGKNECYGIEARDFAVQMVQGKTVKLGYDKQCRDIYNRLLAWVEVEGRDLNLTLVERGYACVLYIPPNGEARRSEFGNAEAEAQLAHRGLWGACQPEEIFCE